MSKKKVAFVTGGSGGIGKSICLKLIKSGFYVAVGYKTNKKDANNLTKKNHAIAIQVGDVLEKVTDHTKRCGFVITTGDTRDEAVKRARTVVENIQILTRQ